MDKSWVNFYNQWLWLTPDDILALQYHPKSNKQKIVPLFQGYHTHVTRFKAMYSELQCSPGWTDHDIFKITYDEYMAFSRQYMAGQVTSNPLSPAPNLYASSTDPVTLFMKSIKQKPRTFLLSNRLTSGIAPNVQWMQWLPYNQLPRCWTIPTFLLWGDKPLFILVDIIQESSLWAIVNAGPVGDGQTVWMNIVTEAKKSTMAHISSQSLTAYLPTSKIWDGS
jgi:hypothetical protein